MCKLEVVRSLIQMPLSNNKNNKANSNGNRNKRDTSDDFGNDCTQSNIVTPTERSDSPASSTPQWLICHLLTPRLIIIPSYKKLSSSSIQ